MLRAVVPGFGSIRAIRVALQSRLGAAFIAATLILGAVLEGQDTRSGTTSSAADSRAASSEVLAGAFSHPVGIAVAPTNGRVYVTDEQAGTLFEFPEPGPPRLLTDNLLRPRGIAWESPNHLLLVAEALKRGSPSRPRGLLLRFDLTTRALTILADGLNRPHSVARGDDGTVYVTAEGRRGTGTIVGPDNWSPDNEAREEQQAEIDDRQQAVSIGTVFRWTPGTGLQVVVQGFRRPDGLLVRADGTLLVAAMRFRDGARLLEGSVFSVDASGAVDVYVSDLLATPFGLALDRTGALFVSGRSLIGWPGTRDGLIRKRRTDGTVVDVFTGLNEPRGIAFGLSGALAVAHAHPGQVIRFAAPPPPTLQVPSDTATNQDPFQLRGTAAAGTEIMVLGGQDPASVLAAQGTFEVPVALRDNQPNALRVFAVGRAGNGLASAPAVTTILHDDVAPVVTITSPEDGAIVPTPIVTVTGTIVEALSGLAGITCNGVPLLPPASPFSCNVSLVPGVNTIRVEATDVAGNQQASTRSVTFASTTTPILTITKTHAGDFAQGQEGATYTVTVANAPGAGPTSGTVTVTETAPSGLTLVSMAGAGWQCAVDTCTRSDALAGGASFPPLTVTVNVAADATTPQVNAVAVMGGGSAGANATDSTTITGDDGEGPSLAIVSPAEGAFVFQNRPAIEISFADPSGVNTASLAFTANGDPLTVDCALGAAGGRCTPTTPLPDGEVTVVVSLSDTLGNESMATVSFTVDSAPAEVNITSPADRLVTRAATLDVTGSAGTGVAQVSVNGVAANLSSGSFNVTVPLRDGVNMIVAVATKANGKTGTDSIDVTRDTLAPIVRIDSPRDGFVSPNNTIPVTGLVNDVVNGGFNATVKVNGVLAAVSDGTFMVPQLPLVRGPNVIEAFATDFAGNEARHSITVRFEQPVGPRLAILSGNGQYAAVRQPLAEPFVAVVRDGAGNPVAGRVLQFQVTRNNGLLRLKPEDEGKRTIQVPTDGSGRASVFLTLGDTAGQGNNRVLVTAVGVTGEIEFCASALTAPAQKILMTAGDNQRGAVGQPLATPMEALVVDRDGNPVKDIPVTFRITKGSGSINGSDTAIRPSGLDGIARAILTLGSDPGISNNVVTATFEGLTALPATFTASGMVPGDPAQTRFTGVVLDNGLTPIPGAVVTIEHTAVEGITDDQGQFELVNVPVGKIHLIIDPAKSPRPETFPPLAFETVTVAGQSNVLGQPILIPALNMENSKIVGGPEDVVLKMPGVTGLELTVFANSVTCTDGSRQCRVSISQVHLDKVPMPPPSGTIFMPPAWTVQPAGTKFDPPARISIPNDGMPPGRQIDIFQFDHALNMFVNIGKGTTTEDGLLIISDPGFGISSSGWGGCGQPQPPTTCTLSCNDGKKCTDDVLDSAACSCSNPVKAPTGPACGANTPATVNSPTTLSPGLATGWGVTTPDFANIAASTNICLDGGKYNVRVGTVTVPFLQDFNTGATPDCDSIVPSRANFCSLLGGLVAPSSHTFCISRSCLQVHEDRHKTHRLDQWNALNVEASIEALMAASSDQVCTVADAQSQLTGKVNKAVNDAVANLRSTMAATRAASEALAIAAHQACHAPKRTNICSLARAPGTDGDTRPWIVTNPCGGCP